MVSLDLTYLVEFFFVTFPPQNGGSASGNDPYIDDLAISLHILQSIVIYLETSWSFLESISI